MSQTFRGENSVVPDKREPLNMKYLSNTLNNRHSFQYFNEDGIMIEWYFIPKERAFQAITDVGDNRCLWNQSSSSGNRVSAAKSHEIGTLPRMIMISKYPFPVYFTHSEYIYAPRDLQMGKMIGHAHGGGGWLVSTGRNYVCVFIVVARCGAVRRQRMYKGQTHQTPDQSPKLGPALGANRCTADLIPHAFIYPTYIISFPGVSENLPPNKNNLRAQATSHTSCVAINFSCFFTYILH